MSVTINGTSGVVFNDGSSQTTAATGFGFKNRIINGAMVIDQRNAGASYSTVGTSYFNSAAYTVDRWNAIYSQSTKFTVQQNAGSVTPPAGYRNYLGATSTSAYTVITGDYFGFGQRIEGFNTADLNWGTANAATVTLSFWVRSSLTGTFGGAVSNSANDRSYAFNYTISSANTWEQKSITIAGDTSGTWIGATNGTGIQLTLPIAIGTQYAGAAGSWASALYIGATGTTSVVGTNGATFYITGVQLEKGSTATSFDYRPYGTEVALCQRYYEEMEVLYFTLAWAAIVNQAFWKVTKRAAPTITGAADGGTGGAYISFGSANAKFASQCNQIFQSGANSANSGGIARGNSEL
jgi:hypothetical protein